MNNLHHLLGDPIGLTANELRAWNWHEFVGAAGRQDVAKLGFYRSVSNATVAARGRPQADIGAFAIPSDIFSRDMTAADAGSALVSTKQPFHLSSYLGRSLVSTLPLRRLRGLRESVTIPKGVGGATATWLAADGSSPIAEDTAATGQISLSPKAIATLCEVTHTLGRQAGPAGSAYILGELELGLSKALDAALLAGSGVSGQPLSPFKTPGVGAAAGASITWADVCSLTTSAEAVQVGVDRPSWVLGVNAASTLRQRERASGSGFVFDDGRIAGYDAMVSQAAPTA